MSKQLPPPRPSLLLGFCILFAVLVGPAHGIPAEREANENHVETDATKDYRESLGKGLGWFRYTSKGSNPPPLPGGMAATSEDLPECVLGEEDNLLHRPSENDGELVLKRTLVVDGCLLDCRGARIIDKGRTVTSKIRAVTLSAYEGSTEFGYEPTSQESIIVVRNGGHVKNCRLGIRLPNFTGRLQEYLSYDDVDTDIEEEEDDAEGDERNRKLQSDVWYSGHNEDYTYSPTDAPTKTFPPTTFMPTPVYWDVWSGGYPDFTDPPTDESGSWGMDVPPALFRTLKTDSPTDETDAPTELHATWGPTTYMPTTYMPTPLTPTSPTVAPTSNPTVKPTGTPTETPTVGPHFNTEISGIRCDQGDCHLTNTGCIGFRYADSNTGLPVFRSCVETKAGAGTVRIRGSSSSFDLSTPGNSYRVSRTGIFVAGASRLFVDNLTIRNQQYDGITISKKSNALEAVRIADTNLEHNDGNGILLDPDYGNGYFAILGGRIQHNRENGIKLQGISAQDIKNRGAKGRITVALSDVVVSDNSLQGLELHRLEVDLAIEGGAFERNDRSGISIHSDSIHAILRNVVSRHNRNDGLNWFAGIDRDPTKSDNSMTIDQSEFVRNGQCVTCIGNGIEILSAGKVAITNTAFKLNRFDGLRVMNVPDLTLHGVDASANWGAGIFIDGVDYEPGSGEPPYRANLADVRTCYNDKGGMKFGSDEWHSGGVAIRLVGEEKQDNKIVSCGNSGFDFVIGKVLVDEASLPNKIVSDGCSNLNLSWSKESAPGCESSSYTGCDGEYHRLACQSIFVQGIMKRFCDLEKDCQGLDPDHLV